MSGGGGGRSNRKAIQKQYEYDTAKWQFDWQQMQDKYQHSLDAFETQVWNQGQKIDFENEVALDKWQDQEKIRIFDYNNQIKAYNASVESYETQLDYNNLAAELTASDNTRKYNERLTKIGFDNEKLMDEHGFNIRSMTQDFKGKQADAAFKSEQSKLKNMQQKGQIQNMGQAGRTARKNMHAAMAAFGQQQSALVDAITRSESSYALGMEKGFKDTARSQRELRESMKSAGSQYEMDQSQAALQKYSADLSAESKLAPMPVQRPQMTKPLKVPKPRNLAPEEPPSWEQYESIKPIKGAISKPSTLQKLGAVVGTIASKLFSFSDDRLKYNITRIGNSAKGIPIYTFKYRFDGAHGPTYKGTSAQDLLEIGRKDAVGTTEDGGFYYVDYSKLDVDFEKLT